MAERLITVEEAFAGRGKGVLVMPRFTAVDPDRALRPVELRRPDGTRRAATATLEVAHMRGAAGAYAMWRLVDASEADVPAGTEIWSLDDSAAAGG